MPCKRPPFLRRMSSARSSRALCVWAAATPLCFSLRTRLIWLWCLAWSTRSWELMRRRPALRSQGLGRSWLFEQNSRDLISSKMNAAEVACFVLDSSAPSPVLVALQFLNKRLYFELDLTLAFDLKKIRKAITGIGQKQAPVAQPILVAKLEESITQSIRGSGFKWLGFYATWCVATGRVRWVRVHRSRLLRMTETSMVFECLRGKQRQRRCDFFFGVAPGSASLRGLTLVMPFGNALKTMPAFPSSLPCS